MTTENWKPPEFPPFSKELVQPSSVIADLQPMEIRVKDINNMGRCSVPSEDSGTEECVFISDFNVYYSHGEKRLVETYQG